VEGLERVVGQHEARGERGNGDDDDDDGLAAMSALVMAWTAL
jgi:hypothetical protein